MQRTIRRELLFEGTGLHTGRQVAMWLRPAPRDTGVVFVRSDKGAVIPCNLAAVSDTAFATTLGTNGTRVKTVEHLLAALSGLEVDNVSIDLDGPEVPIMDGSALGFARRILEGGIARQSSIRPALRVTRPVVFKEGHAEIAVLPHDGRIITYQMEFEHRLLGRQRMCVDLEEQSFMTELAPARTFGFLKDVEYLKSRGLAKGGSLDNAVIVAESGILNDSGLRFEDEFIRHKILDFIGDMALCGFPVYGHFLVSRSGHTTNTRFFRKLLASPDCWEVVTEVGESLQASA